MTRLVRGVGPVLLALAAGCLSEDKLTVLQPGASGPPGPAQAMKLPQAPATEEAARRVAGLGHRLVEANPQLAVRPSFLCIGAPQPVLFHRLNREACEVFVSDSMVKQCATDGQLAAVLCTELGRLAAEQAALASPAPQRLSREPPPYVAVGHDESAAFGGPDRTRLAELALMDKQRDQAGLSSWGPPRPDLLARSFLLRAGFAATDLQAVAPLLRAADQDATYEKQLSGKR
jgi:hypothetical protein